MDTGQADLVAQYWTVSGTGPDDAEAGRGWSPFGFRERCAEAQRVGFRGIGLFFADLEHLLERHTLAELRSVLDEHGIETLELEYLWDWFLPAADPRRQASNTHRELLFEAARVLRAHHVKVGNLAGASCPPDLLIERFAELCADGARRHDALIAYEFTPFDVNVDSIDAALALVRGADAPNGVIAVDTWHMAKLGIAPDDLRLIPEGVLGWVELSDGRLRSSANLADEGVNHRRVPGDGELAISDYVRVCQEIGYRGPWGVEVLSQEFRELPMKEMFQRAYSGAAGQVRSGSVGVHLA